MAKPVDRDELKTGGVAADRLRLVFCSVPPRRALRRSSRDPVSRFIEKVRPGIGGCLEWCGSLSPQGYGWFSWESKPVLAHRWSYEAYSGVPIPDKMVIDHLCRNTKCINPAHLECVEMRENTRRGMLHDLQRAKAKAQSHCKREHPLFGQNLLINSAGHRSCKACQRAAAIEWRRNNRGRINSAQQARRAAIRRAA